MHTCTFITRTLTYTHTELLSEWWENGTCRMRPTWIATFLQTEGKTCKIFFTFISGGLLKVITSICLRRDWLCCVFSLYKQKFFIMHTAVLDSVCMCGSLAFSPKFLFFFLIIDQTNYSSRLSHWFKKRWSIPCSNIPANVNPLNPNTTDNTVI